MANIANLSVQLTAKTGRFTSGMRSARAPVTKFANTVAHAHRRVALFAGGLFALGAGAGFSVLIKRSFETIDALAKTADKLGVNTEALGGFRFAAKKAGIEANTLDMALQRMTRRVSEAAYGTGEAQGAIKELGLDARELAGIDLEQQLYMVADAMQSIPNPADRVRLAFKMFDSEGVAMVNMLQDGVSGLMEMQRAFQDTGAAVDRVEAAKIEEANNAIISMRASLESVANITAIELAPYITVATERITEFMEQARSGAPQIVKVFRAIETGASALGNVFDTLNRWLLDAQESVLYVYKYMHKLYKLGEREFMPRAGLSAPYEARKGPTSALNPEAVRRYEKSKGIRIDYDTQAEADSIAAGIDKAIEETRTKRLTIETRTPAAEKIRGFFADIDAEAQAAAQGIAQRAEEAAKSSADRAAEAARSKAFEKIAKEGEKIFEKTRTPLEQYTSKIEDLNNLYEQGAISGDTYMRAIRDARKELDDANDKLDDHADKIKKVERLQGKFETNKFGGRGRFGPRGIGVASSFAPSLIEPSRQGMMPFERSPDLDRTNEILLRIESALNQQRVARAV